VLCVGVQMGMDRWMDVDVCCVICFPLCVCAQRGRWMGVDMSCVSYVLICVGAQRRSVCEDM